MVLNEKKHFSMRLNRLINTSLKQLGELVCLQASPGLYSLHHTLTHITVFDFTVRLSSKCCNCHFVDEETEGQKEVTCPGSDSCQWQSQALNSCALTPWPTLPSDHGLIKLIALI